MTSPVTTKLLISLPMFRKVDPKTVASIAEHASILNVPKNAFVFHRGDQCAGFFSVVSGKIKIIFLSPEGREHIARILGPGDAFAEAVMFLDKPCPANTQAIVDSKVLFIPKQVIHESIENNPKFARQLLAGISQRLHELVMELESLTVHSAKQRVVGYLVHLEESASGNQATEWIEFPVKKTLIARSLNLTPETLSRTLHELCKEGLIEMRGRSVHVNDMEKLRQLL